MSETPKNPGSGRKTKAKPATSRATKRKASPAARTSRKTAAGKTAAPKPTAQKVPAKATVKSDLRVVPQAPETAPESVQEALRKRALIDSVVTQTGLKKKDVKPVIEAALAQMGACLAEGRELNLPPFGKLKVKRSKDLANARVSIVRLRQPKRG